MGDSYRWMSPEVQVGPSLVCSLVSEMLAVAPGLCETHGVARWPVGISAGGTMDERSHATGHSDV